MVTCSITNHYVPISHVLIVSLSLQPYPARKHEEFNIKICNNTVVMENKTIILFKLPEKKLCVFVEWHLFITLHFQDIFIQACICHISDSGSVVSDISVQ